MDADFDVEAEVGLMADELYEAIAVGSVDLSDWSTEIEDAGSEAPSGQAESYSTMTTSDEDDDSA